MQADPMKQTPISELDRDNWLSKIDATGCPKTDRGHFIGLSHGRRFYPLDARPEDIEIRDIAAFLSKVCRYGGHCREFYSVAQHSVLVSHVVPAPLALWGLLHDAAEAYIGDLVRPLKIVIPGYKPIEDGIMRAICERFGLSWPAPPEIKHADNIVLATEYRDLMVEPGSWGELPAPLESRIVPWSPGVAEDAFLTRFLQVTGDPLARPTIEEIKGWR